MKAHPRETAQTRCLALARNFLEDPAQAQACLREALAQAGEGDLPALARATRRLARLRAPEGGRMAALVQELDRALPLTAPDTLPAQGWTGAAEAFLQNLLPESRRLFLRRYFWGEGIGPLAVAFRQNEVGIHDQLDHLRQQLVGRLQAAGTLPPDGAALFAALDDLPARWVAETAGLAPRRGRKVLPAVLGAAAGVALVAAIVVANPPAEPTPQGLAGEPGVIQDGVYYVYAGSGFGLPGQEREAVGLFRYTPGQGAEELVSCADHPIVTGANYGWDVNSHGLYYIDRETGQLFRQDLESGAETLLYTIPDEDFYLPEDQLDEGDLWDYYVHGETPEVLSPAAIWFQEVTEDQVVLTYRHTDGASNDTLVLDSRTGEELSRTPDPDPREGWTTHLGGPGH